MDRREFMEEIKTKDKTEISMEDCINYYKFFQNIGEDLRERMLGRETLNEIGYAMRIYWERAFSQYCILGKDMVQTPCGLYLKSNKNHNNPARMKTEKEVPLNLPAAECKNKFKEYASRIKGIA